MLGWAGHELQWRGATPEPGIREPDIRQAYTAPRWQETADLLDRYHVDYVIVGPLELATYGPGVKAKFDRALEVVFEGEGVAIYRWNSQQK